MTPNEEYVLEALQKKFGGTIMDGEDPPDAYLCIEEKRIAVEVTRLIEQVTDDNGAKISRLAHDGPAIDFLDDVDREMQNTVPDGKYVFIVIGAPIKNIRLTRKKIIAEISEKI